MGYLLGYARFSTTDQHPQLRASAKCGFDWLTMVGCVGG
jgi:hypothetical protein